MSPGRVRVFAYHVCVTLGMRLHWRTQDLKKGGVVVEGDHPKGEGAGGGCAPLPREARKLLKTLIRCAKMHEKITSFQLAEHARYF